MKIKGSFTHYTIHMQECLKQCIHLIQNGASVCVFPEGTRSKDGKLGDFKVFGSLLYDL